MTVQAYPGEQRSGETAAQLQPPAPKAPVDTGIGERICPNSPINHPAPAPSRSGANGGDGAGKTGSEGIEKRPSAKPQPDRSRAAVETSTNGAGCVTYFIQALAGGPIKIGKSTTAALDGRLRTIQTGNPWPLRVTSVLDGDQERSLHKRFAAARICGEWFEPTADLCALASAVEEDPGGAYRRGFRDGYAEGVRRFYQDACQTLSEVVDEMESGLHRDATRALEDDLPEVLADVQARGAAVHTGGAR